MAAGSPTARRRPPLTRERIVQAALAEIEDSGADALSLRGLARSLGVTAPAIYDHVANKDALIREVAAVGYMLLDERYDVIEGDRPIDRCIARARTYVDFAIERRELFRVMFQFRPDAVEIPVDNTLPEASKHFDAGTADIASAIRDGDLIERDPVHLALTIWAGIHGVATIGLLSGTLARSVRDDVVDSMFRGLRPDA